MGKVPADKSPPRDRNPTMSPAISAYHRRGLHRLRRLGRLRCGSRRVARAEERRSRVPHAINCERVAHRGGRSGRRGRRERRRGRPRRAGRESGRAARGEARIVRTLRVREPLNKRVVLQRRVRVRPSPSSGGGGSRRSRGARHLPGGDGRRAKGAGKLDNATRGRPSAQLSGPVPVI